MSELYCDGGVIDRNPSKDGGTWAFVWVIDDLILKSGYGVITPAQAGMETVSNNLTEMLALVRGLQSLPAIWSGTVLSDSQITLGRAFDTWKWKNIPNWLRAEFEAERARLTRWEKVEHTLLQGHPTKAELAAGFGSRGYPVSEWNVWCDKACNQMAAEFLERRGKPIFAGGNPGGPQ